MLTIENFGLRWRREKIAWGRGGKASTKGHLIGTLRRRKSTKVDFREQIGIYVLYNDSDRPIYVGQAGIVNKRLFGRLKDHRKDHLRDRWTHFSWFGLQGYNEKSKEQIKSLSAFHKPETVISHKNRKDALYEIEAVLISVVEPALNKQGSNWTGSREFIQYNDPLVPQTTEEIIIELPRKLLTLEKQINTLRTKVRR
jgi:hypothetical protein